MEITTKILLFSDRKDRRELVMTFLCKARNNYAGRCVSVRGYMSGEMLTISGLKIRTTPVVRTIFCVILRNAIKIPIYDAFRFLIIAKSSQHFVKGPNVESFSRERQAKTLAAARKFMHTQGRT